jgi:hypothetical protein
VAGKCLYPDGPENQNDPEYRSGDRGGFMAFECIWIVRWIVEHSRGWALVLVISDGN